LDYPKRDPHGDPIPDAEGNFQVSNKVLLSNLKKGEAGTLVGVKDTSSEFLKYLDKNNIALGETIKVLDKEEFDGSMQIQVRDESLNVSPLVTVNIYIKP
jgi:DtxR family Mn-dependent transcriptional regulator